MALLEEVCMKRLAIAGVATLAIVGSTTVYAQYRPWFHEHMREMRFSPEDRAAFVDARIAAVHAGLKLTADQEKLWPPVEAAVRDFAKMRIDRAEARMKDGESQDQQKEDDPIARLRKRADNLAATSEAMRKIADAADPLYKTLDDAQKRRLAILTHHERHFGGGGFGWWRHHWMERHMERDGGSDRDGRGERL
jgi:hypothetical protein